MSNTSIIRLLVLGALAIGGILFIQGYYTLKNWNIQDDEFDTSVRIALRKSAEALAKFNGSKLPKTNLIQRRASNTYAVNFNDEIDAQLLEDFLIQNFEKLNLNIDFEYALYDCSSDEMVYGNYCDIGEGGEASIKGEELPKFQELNYYFVVRFPSHAGYVLSNIRQSIFYNLIALLSIAFFIYAMVIILRQRRLSQMQKDFINNMTHEFKTPITSIKLAANTIAKMDKVKEDNRLSRYIGIIDEQSARLNNQVEKILNIATIDVNGMELQLESLNLNEIISDIVKNFEVRLNDVNGEIIFNENANITVLADRTHLTNVIYSLLDNAIKYSKSPVLIEISIFDNRIEIEDNGIGISDEDQKNIFKKFYRVHTGNVHNVKGFGLGLHYVKNVIRGFGWRIKLESELQKGTCFTIFFNK